MVERKGDVMKTLRKSQCISDSFKNWPKIEILISPIIFYVNGILNLPLSLMKRQNSATIFISQYRRVEKSHLLCNLLLKLKKKKEVPFQDVFKGEEGRTKVFFK